ncbi:hypothetical protein Ddc_00981 [Ditylenchus destructor]|nr:hypothetical protein Ddc_00981 [Ditylenchus destructor]
MFRRWKQLIREKTGHAQQTQLPEDVEKFIDITFELRNTMEQIDKSVEDMIAGWRSVRMNVQEQIGEPCGILSMKAEGSGQIQRGFLEDVCQMFLRIENKQAIDICNDLKRTRLEMDSRAAEYNE